MLLLFSVSASAFTVTFNAGGGTCATPSGSGTNLSAATAPAGWTFTGWAESAATSTTVAPTTYAAAADYTPTADVTLYAVYSVAVTTSGTASKTFNMTPSPAFTSYNTLGATYIEDGITCKANNIVSIANLGVGYNPGMRLDKIRRQLAFGILQLYQGI